MAPGFDGTIRIDSSISAKGFNNGIRGIVGSLKGVGAAIAAVFAVGAIVNFGKTAVDEASKLASALTGLESVTTGVGINFQDAQKFIDDFISDGLIPATNAITAYKNLALRGYDVSQIEKTLTALKDAAAFGRQSSLSIGEAVQSASEGLKNENSILVDNAGVTKNVAQMWKEYAATLGTTADSLTKEQKIQAEVNGILEETRSQTGDAAKLSGGYAGQVAALSTSFYNLRVAVGNAIIPILSKVIPYIKAIVDWFVVLINTVARFIALFFNVDASMNSTAAASEGVAEQTAAAASSAGKLAGNSKKAEKAAKGALAAFDELNVLQMDQPDAGGAGGAAASGGLGAGSISLGEPKDLDELTERVAAFKKKLMELLGPAIEAFGRLKEALLPLGETIWSGLKWAWENILVPFGTWVLNDAVPAFLDLLASAVDVLNEYLIALKPWATWLWENFLLPIAEWTGGAIINVLTWLRERLDDIGEWISTQGPKGFATFTGIIGSLETAFLNTINAIVKFKDQAIATWDEIKKKWGEAGDWFRTNVTDRIKDLFKPAWDFIQILANNSWIYIQYIWGKVSAWWLENVVDPLKEMFTDAWETIEQAFQDAWDTIVDVWGVVSEWFTTTVIDPIKEAFEDALKWIKDEWERIFTSIGNFVKGIFNGIIDKLNGLLAGIVTGINDLINAANKAGSVLPGWKVIPTVTAPKIPRLATGAVIPPNAEFLALLGDQKSGRNLEAPESLIRQIMREEMGKIEADIKIDFTGRLSGLVRELKPLIDKENVRIGRSLVAGT